jgi:hypothetical protein
VNEYLTASRMSLAIFLSSLLSGGGVPDPTVGANLTIDVAVPVVVDGVVHY